MENIGPQKEPKTLAALKAEWMQGVSRVDKQDFKNEYMGVPWSTANDYLFQLVEEYHRRAEMYDRSVCTAETPLGTALPANGMEYSLVNKNARMLISEIASREGVSENIVRDAIRRHNDL